MQRKGIKNIYYAYANLYQAAEFSMEMSSPTKNTFNDNILGYGRPLLVYFISKGENMTALVSYYEN